MDKQKELEKVQAENNELFEQHQAMIQEVSRLAQKIQQNNGVIMFLQGQIKAEKNSKTKTKVKTKPKGK